MAQAQTATFAQFKILVGDGASPEVFALICGLTTKGVDFSTSTQTSEVPDCTDEDLPSWQEIAITSVGATITGSGMWSVQSHGDMVNWILDGDVKNVQVRWDNAATGDPLYLEGAAVMTALGNSVQKGQKVNQNISLAFTQKPTVHDAS